MSCPSCGGDSRVMLSPGYFQCTSSFSHREPTGAHPSGAFGPAYRYVSSQCVARYQEGTGQPGQQPCSTHALFAVGLCVHCRRTPVCGSCPQQMCASCYSEEQARRAKEETKIRVSQRAKDEERRKAERAAHDADAQANIAKHPRSQEYYRAELNNIDAMISEAGNSARGREATGGTIFQAILGVLFVLVAMFVLIASPVKAASIGPSVVALILLLPAVPRIRSSLARSRREALNTRRAQLLPALGCGKACQFGCHTYQRG